MLAKTTAKALANLFKKAQTSKWWTEQLIGQAIQIIVINPAGKRVYANLKGHLRHEDHTSKIGDVFHCSDGHEYLKANGKVYNYDPTTDTWYDSTDKG